jgi:alginate O-acetyltransferase complex protein AlgI
MKFNSLSFLFLFLPIVMIAWRIVRPRRARLVLMTAASYLFYWFAAGPYAALMLLSTTVDFTVGILLEHADTLPLDEAARTRRRKLILVLSLVFNLGLLSFFKYFTFFVDSVNTIWGSSPPLIRQTMNVVLPAGISFYTFQSMGYSIDVYRRDLRASRNFLEFAAFVSLFPQLIAGPIVRPAVLLPQLVGQEKVDNSKLTEGLFLFACGLCKKVLVADRLSYFADPILNAPRAHGAADLWLAMVGFTLQIYFDFSGYSDMARGLAKMLGLELTENFDSPYHADSPSDFWKRWHISLSSWLRDYLYIPLGGNRKGKARTGANLFVTMLLGGLWHGAGVNFLLWGALHGTLLLVYHRVEKPWATLPLAARRALMLVIIVITWIPFRMHTAADLGAFAKGAFRFGAEIQAPWQLVAFSLLGAGLAALPVCSNRIRWGQLGWGKVLALAAATVLAILHLNLSSKFLYFQF